MIGMPRLLQRLAAALFGATPVVDDTEADASGPSKQGTEQIDEDAATSGWFEGRQNAGRDSIDSNPDTARWYRRPRYVVPGAATHRTSTSFKGSN